MVGEIRHLRYARQTHSALARNAGHAFAARHALSIYRPGAIYSLIPKNACSTMRYSIALANGFIKGPEDIGWIHENNDTFVARQDELVCADYTFVVLRCPFRRLASMFLNKFVSGEFRLDRMWNTPEQRKNRIARVWSGKFAKDPWQEEWQEFTFRKFVDFLEHPQGLTFNSHWTPQVNFLVYESYDDVFQVENFSHCAIRLSARIGVDVQDARKLTGHGLTGATDVASARAADTSVRDLCNLIRTRSPPGYKTLYDPHLAKRVAQIYQADVNLYAQHFGAGGLLFPDLA